MGKSILKFSIFIFTLSWIIPASAEYAPLPRPRGTTVFNVKDFGATPNDSYDDTAAIQRAVNALPISGGTVTIPGGTYMIDTTKNIDLKNKMHLQLASTTILKAIPNSEERSYVINILQAQDVEVSGGQIFGDRTTHLGTTGEWGHGIMVRGSKGVTIRNIKISNSWGDGISIGATFETATQPSIYSNDVILDNVISTNNRRQGLSIGRSTNVKVFDSEFSHTNGAKPQYGIDIEPDPIGDFHTTNVHIENCKIHHNVGGGIQVYKKAYDVIISTNNISYNGFGIYTVGAITGTIWNNKFAHNKYHGVALRTGTVDYQVFANIFRNNYTVNYGVTNDTNPLTTITGYTSGNSTLSPHLNIAPETSAISIRRNMYAR